MSKLKKIYTIFTSLLMIAIGIIVCCVPADDALVIVSIVLGFFITVKALKDFIFYFTHAKHMVGGKKILINSVIELDFGLLSFFILIASPTLGILYLFVIYMILGVIDILHGFEIKKNEGKRWQIKIIIGSLSIVLALSCIVLGGLYFFKVYKDAVLIMPILYGVGWAIKGIVNIIMCFYKNSVIYVDEQAII